MAQRIPTAPITMQHRDSTSSTMTEDSRSSSPQLLTPVGTPPAHQHGFMSFFGGGSGIESKLHQFLANLDADSHSFCRGANEDASQTQKTAVTPEPIASKLVQIPPIAKSSILSSLSPVRPAPVPQQSMTAALAVRRKSDSETRHFDPSREPKLLGLL